MQGFSRLSGHDHGPDGKRQDDGRGNDEHPPINSRVAVLDEFGRALAQLATGNRRTVFMFIGRFAPLRGAEAAAFNHWLERCVPALLCLVCVCQWTSLRFDTVQVTGAWNGRVSPARTTTGLQHHHATPQWKGADSAARR